MLILDNWSAGSMQESEDMVPGIIQATVEMLGISGVAPLMFRDPGGARNWAWISHTHSIFLDPKSFLTHI